MARKTLVIVEDDLGGGAADESVTFALDGATYEIDLSAANAASLRDGLSVFIAAARRVSGGRRIGGGGPARTDKEQLDAIRRWARENGYEVSSRGRISKVVRDAYNASR
ncbi:MAG: Lsr2 family protein [Micropruina sp.]